MRNTTLLLPLLFASLAHGAGGPGSALQFADSLGKVSVAHTNALNAYPLTVTAWFRFLPSFPPGSVDLVKKHDGSANGWRLRILNDSLTAAYALNNATNVGSVAGFSAGFVGDGAWHHAALTVDAGGGRLYLDGVLATSQSWIGTAGAPTNTQSLLLGGEAGPVASFDLTLDEVTVWNVALSQSQIQTNMNRSLTGAETGLIAYYRCDEGSGSTAADSAPAAGNNNGSLAGPFFLASWILPFTPFVETLAATGIGPTNATLNGVANPEGANTSGWFEWGTTTNYGNTTAAQPLGSGAGNTNFSQLITALAGGVSCQFRAVASNYWGVAKGTNQSFTAPVFAPAATNLPGMAFGSVAWGDYDNDGKLDLLLAGYLTNTAGPLTELWRNSGGTFFKVTPSPPVSTYNFVAVWGDADNDGWIDFPTMQPRTTKIPDPGLAKNIGGNFTNSATPSGAWFGSAAWGDYDNDGRLDLLRSGFASTIVSNIAGPYVAWQRITSQFWRNTSDGFVPIQTDWPSQVYGSIVWGDYDNDGRLDVLLTGITNATWAFNTIPVTQLWRNTGSGFTNVGLGLPGTCLGSAVWGDYDNDGRLDILLTGATNVLTYYGDPYHTNFVGPFFVPENLALDFPTRYDYGYPTGFVAQIWRNTVNGFSNINAGLPGVWVGSAAWGDFDNDGRQDVLLTGATNITAIWGPSGYSNVTNVYGWPKGFVSQIWRNTTNGFSNLDAAIPAVAYSSAAWGDYDNDGRLDVVIAGATAMASNFIVGTYGTYPALNPTNYVTQVWRNFSPATNSPPAPPADLTVAPTGHGLTFGWNAPTDAQTPAAGLTYNLRVGITPGGGEIVGPMAAGNGSRRLPQPGNTSGQRSHTSLGMPFGQTIYWSVQAIDGAFAGSPFAPEQSVSATSVLTARNGSPVGPLAVPGDASGDGIVDQNELNTVLSNYWPYSPWLYMTNVAGLGGTNVTFALSNSTAGTFSVEYTTNFADWYYLGPATPRYLFTDTNAPAVPQRFYRLRWP